VSPSPEQAWQGKGVGDAPSLFPQGLGATPTGGQSLYEVCCEEYKDSWKPSWWLERLAKIIFELTDGALLKEVESPWIIEELDWIGAMLNHLAEKVKELEEKVEKCEVEKR